MTITKRNGFEDLLTNLYDEDTFNNICTELRKNPSIDVVDCHLEKVTRGDWRKTVTTQELTMKVTTYSNKNINELYCEVLLALMNIDFYLSKIIDVRTSWSLKPQ
jgi:hypothetical protein